MELQAPLHSTLQLSETLFQNEMKLSHKGGKQTLYASSISEKVDGDLPTVSQLNQSDTHASHLQQLEHASYGGGLAQRPPDQDFDLQSSLIDCLICLLCLSDQAQTLRAGGHRMILGRFAALISNCHVPLMGGALPSEPRTKILTFNPA